MAKENIEKPHENTLLQFKKKKSKNKKSDLILPSNQIMVKKFLDILSSNIKMLSSFQDSLLLLAFLNEMGLDPTSTLEKK